MTGVSRGRGFAGGVRRHNFHGGPKTHGQSDRHRAPGSIGSGTTPGRVYKGQKMAGHMGAVQVTSKNLRVIAKDEAKGLLLVEGAVPGATNATVRVQPREEAQQEVETMKLTVHDAAGKEVETIDVDDAVFGIEPNEPVVHQAFVASQANKRVGHARRRRRAARCTDSTKKIRAQKGTGALAAGRRSARRSTGTAASSSGRGRAATTKDLPKRMRRLAIRSVLSAKAADGSLRVVNDLGDRQAEHEGRSPAC